MVYIYIVYSNSKIEPIFCIEAAQKFKLLLLLFFLRVLFPDIVDVNMPKTLPQSLEFKDSNLWYFYEYK